MPRSRRAAGRRNRGTVGQVGLGIMGGAFAKHLLASGHMVVCHDVAPAALRMLTRAVGRAAESGAAVASQAKIIITSLP